MKHIPLLQSMTGFGSATFVLGEERYDVSLRSLNSRFLEFNVRLPNVLQHFESQIRERILGKLKRGKVDLSITLNAANRKEYRGRNSKELFESIENFLKIAKHPKFKRLTAQEQSLFFSWLSRNEGLFSSRIEITENVEKVLLNAIDKSLQQFEDSRVREGARISKAIYTILKKLEGLCNAVDTKRLKNPTLIRKKILERLNLISAANVVLDPGRIEQEVLWHLEKIDVEEEIQRLRSHIKEVRELKAGEPQGRRLDFLSQELGRELNTLGAKIQDAKLQRLIVEGKLCNEQIKEQVQNVL